MYGFMCKLDDMDVNRASIYASRSGQFVVSEYWYDEGEKVERELLRFSDYDSADEYRRALVRQYDRRGVRHYVYVGIAE